MKRRTAIQLLTQAMAAAGIASSLPMQAMAGSGKPMKILFMGGTGFIGPHMVRALVAEGHDVWLFNRGKSNPHLFKELNRIKGDRLTDDIKQLSEHQWDLIVDSSCYIPRAVDMLMEAVDTSSVQQYVFISTISVYADFSRPGLHEGSELARMDEDPNSEEVNKYYGALKVKCEQQAEKHMPGKATMVRCGLIVGPGDSTDRFTYWPVRAAQSDEMLAPGTGDDYMQTIDVRDLADWVVTCINNRLVGPYNSTNPAGKYQIKDVLTLCKSELNPDLNLTWVSAEFLEGQDLESKGGLPLWIPPGSEYSGVWQTDASLAASKGLKARPLEHTIRDLYAWWQEQPEDRRNPMRTGISLEDQAQILAAWHEAQSS